MFIHKNSSVTTLLALAALTAGISGCGGASTPAQDAATAAATAEVKQAEADRAADLAARAADIAKREEDLTLKQREQQLAQREAEVAARESAVGTKPKKATSAPARPAVVAAAEKPAAAPPPPPPSPVTLAVPAGTQLSVELTSGLSSKTSVVGEAFNARLATDVVVDGRRALAAGTRVTGSVTEVISGSNRIGGIPTLGLRFDSVEAPTGKKIGISGALVQQGKSDNLKDGAKIAGGAAAGAIIGHQIKSNDGGKIIGGLLGGAAGALIARKTGAEVELPAGTVLAIVLDAPFEVTTKP